MPMSVPRGIMPRDDGDHPMTLPIRALMLAVCAFVSPSRAAEPVAPVPYSAVRLGGPFWGPRLATFTTVTLDANRRQCELTGRVRNFENAAKKLKGELHGAYEGLLFNDSDVYKMIEGWSYAIAIEPDESRRKSLTDDLDALIAKIAAAQHPDGYLNTYYTLRAGVENRFTKEELDHETYCLGHLIEAGVVHAQATGKTSLLSVAVKAAEFLDALYAPGKFSAPPGHQQLELALVKLARHTVQDKYRVLSERLLEMRGRPHIKLDGTTYGPWGDYAQDHKPVAEQFEAVGHAVRAGYMYAAMTDHALLGKKEYVPALNALWEDITQRRVFVTGGIGPSAHNEGFTIPYDIPTASAYQETCASIALCMWAHRMFLLHGDAEYMDQFERTLYNAVLAGVSTSGDRFFYVNPLATRGSHRRTEWFSCACCPPNVLRFFASLGGYVYGVRGDTVYVNLFAASRASLDVNGGKVEIEMGTGYPFDGEVGLRVRNTTGKDVKVAIRRVFGLRFGEDAPGTDDGYGRMTVPAGQTAMYDFEIPLVSRRVYADPRVKALAGRVAVMRGPLVYAAEAIDNPGGVSHAVLPPNVEFEEERAPFGVTIVHASGLRAVAGPTEDGLYRGGPSVEPVRISMRPYFLWNNRSPEKGEAMQVWMPESVQVLDPLPVPGIAASASKVGNGDGVLALFDRLVGSSSGDTAVPRFTFWPAKGDGSDSSDQWIRYDFDTPRKVRSVEVTWFDDTGHGECRVPEGCVVETLDGETWKRLGDVGVAKDAANRATFDAVTTKALRLRVRLQKGFSGGVLEWSVIE
jgi:uncharacterized protein